MSLPIRLPIVGVLGVCSGAVSDPADGVGFPPHPEKSSGVTGPPGAETEGRLLLPRCEK